MSREPVRRVAYLSVHTSPLAQPGVGDAGGMNVYIDELARAMAGRGLQVDVYTRATKPGRPPEVQVAPGYRVVEVPAGPPAPLPTEALTGLVEPFAEAVLGRLRGRGGGYDVVHSHYWLSGWVGVLLKRALGVPLANSFHTLGRVKDAWRRAGDPPETSPPRLLAEEEVIANADCVVASTPAEAEDLLEHYGADPAKLCVSPPGVDHGVFRPGSKEEARRFLGLDGGPWLLFVGRIQPLKGLDVAVGALEELAADLPVRLLVVGGPSGERGEEELARVRRQAREAGLESRVRFVPAQAHASLAAFYQAADVLVVPSRSESFGLVAAEAQACGLPVVAARVGGLAHSVDDGRSGHLVDGWHPPDYASAIRSVLTDPEAAARLGRGGVEHAAEFSWEATCDRLLELYEGIRSPSQVA